MVLPLLLVLYELHPSSTHPYLLPFLGIHTHPMEVPTLGVYTGEYGYYREQGIVGIP